MRMLTVSVLVCAVMALTAAAAVPEAEPVNMTGPSIEEESQIAEKLTLCHDEWTYINGRCFLYVHTLMTWANAEQNCQYHGGNLASVHSFNDHTMIQNMILKGQPNTNTNKYPDTWLGGSDAQQEGTWFWSDGKPFRFSYWSARQPDNLGNADCLVMNYGDERKFGNQPCSYRRPSVCVIKS